MNKTKLKNLNGNTVLLIITIVLFVLMYLIGCMIYSGKGFTHLQTFLNILITNAGLICVACGMTCVMLTGGIDISVGALIAMDCMILAYGMGVKGYPAIPMILFVLGIGLVFGAVQGFLIGYLNIQPFIITMAGMFFARGMTAVICRSSQPNLLQMGKCKNQPSGRSWLRKQEGENHCSLYPPVSSDCAAGSDCGFPSSEIYKIRTFSLCSRRQ